MLDIRLENQRIVNNFMGLAPILQTQQQKMKFTKALDKIEVMQNKLKEDIREIDR